LTLLEAVAVILAVAIVALAVMYFRRGKTSTQEESEEPKKTKHE
jgi:hypothetical protein